MKNHSCLFKAKNIFHHLLDRKSLSDKDEESPKFYENVIKILHLLICKTRPLASDGLLPVGSLKDEKLRCKIYFSTLSSQFIIF